MDDRTTLAERVVSARDQMRQLMRSYMEATVHGQLVADSELRRVRGQLIPEIGRAVMSYSEALRQLGCSVEQAVSVVHDVLFELPMAAESVTVELLGHVAWCVEAAYHPESCRTPRRSSEEQG